MVKNTLTKKGFLGYAQASSAPKLSDVELLQDTAPGFARALERHEESMRGFSLNDIAVVIAAMHQVILDEARWLLEESYKLNGHITKEELAEDEAKSILSSYVLIVDSGLDSDALQPEIHDLLKQAAPKLSVIGELFEFMDDIFMNYKYKMRSSLNPFTAPQFSFLAVEEISGLLLEGFGRWQTDRCNQMKADLMAMSRPEGSGRVPYDSFHAYPRNDDPQAVFVFTESLQRLRDAEALDETGAGQPSVLVANYVQLASNCADTSKYYTICCVDECEGLMRDLEAQVKGPVASPDVLLALLGNLSSTTVDAPRELDKALTDKLRGIANQHSGLVPLHSRLFWQWLHFAFPNECPFPQADVSPARANNPRDAVASASLPTLLLSQWNDQEVLPLEEPSRDPWLRLGLLICSSLQILGLLALLGTMFRLWGAARRLNSAAQQGKSKAFASWSLKA